MICVCVGCGGVAVIADELRSDDVIGVGDLACDVVRFDDAFREEVSWEVGDVFLLGESLEEEVRVEEEEVERMEEVDRVEGGGGACKSILVCKKKEFEEEEGAEKAWWMTEVERWKRDVNC